VSSRFWGPGPDDCWNRSFSISSERPQDGDAGSGPVRDSLITGKAVADQIDAGPGLRRSNRPQKPNLLISGWSIVAVDKRGRARG
jgi:hypothetical protein